VPSRCCLKGRHVLSDHLLSGGRGWCAARQVLRPGDLDDAQLQQDMQQEALFGQHPIFDTRNGVQTSFSGMTMTIQQPNAEITLDEQAGIRIGLPAREATRSPRLALRSRRSLRKSSATA
jgi:hypothetical protein